MVDAALLIFQKLSQEEKNVLKTFEKRILAIYPFKLQVTQLVNLLDKCKQDPSVHRSVEANLARVRELAEQMFANLDFTSVTAEKETLDKFAQEKKHIYEGLLRDQAAGGFEAEQAGKKISYILQDRKSTRLNSSHLKLSRMPSSA